MYKYNFHEIDTEKLGEESVTDQIYRLGVEYKELQDEAYGEDERIILETMDVICAAEGILRKYPSVMVDAACAFVDAHNIMRGYCTEEPCQR